MRGRTIALQCGIGVSVVQGFTLGGRLPRATVPGQGDSSIDDVTDGTVVFEFSPVSTRY